MLTNLADYEIETFAAFDHTPVSSKLRLSGRPDRALDRRRERFDPYHKLAKNPLVRILPANAVTRRALTWQGVTVEVVETTDSKRAEVEYTGPEHLLVVCERGTSRVAETSIDGLPRSSTRELAGKISFVPAGHKYRHCQEPRTPTRFIFVYFDPAKMEACCGPRVLFADSMLLAAALRLREVVENPTPSGQLFLEALGLVILHELQRPGCRPSEAGQPIRGGLASWQQRTVTAFIEEHLADSISLASLAKLVRLSPFHFARAFKQSFGLPPHRFHIARRIERAKTLLVESSMSVTEIGLEIGFSETSAFSATFRRLTGTTPTAYTRSYA